MSSSKTASGTEMNDTAAQWTGRVLSSFPSSYTIFKDTEDGKYRAEYNGRGGTCYESTGVTDASVIIQNARDALVGLGTGAIFIRDGHYDLTSDINITSSGIPIIGESKHNTVLHQNTANTHIFHLEPTAGYIENNRISNMHLIEAGGATTGNAIYINGQVYYGTFDGLLIENAHDGINFNAGAGNRGYRHFVYDTRILNSNNSGVIATEQDSLTMLKLDISACLYGLILQSKVQGTGLYDIRIDNTTSAATYFQDVQILHVQHMLISNPTSYGVIITGGSQDLFFDNFYLEAATEDGVRIANTYDFANENINFTNSTILRCHKTGIVCEGTNAHGLKHLLIDTCTIANNSQDGSGNYYGIECRGAGANATTRGRIINCLIGNLAEDVGNDFQKGIFTTAGCDYFAIKNNDLSTAITTLLSIVGNNNEVEGNSSPKIEHHIADDTLTQVEAGTIHTNLAAGANIKLTLPQNAVAGMTFEFAVMTAGQQLQVDPGAVGALYVNGAKQADDAYIWADDEGESVRLIADGNGDWIALYTQGTWTVV